MISFENQIYDNLDDYQIQQREEVLANNKLNDFSFN